MSKESKATPREFWIEERAYETFVSTKECHDGSIHVIEYSALDKERAKSARLLEAIKWCLDQDWSYGRCGPVGVNMALAEALLSVGEGIE